MASVNLKRNIISALCKFLSIDSETFLSDVDSDVQNLCTKILKSNHGDSLAENSKLQKWFVFVEKLHAESGPCLNVLMELNEELIVKSVLLGKGLHPSTADVIVFAAVHPFVVGTTQSDKEKLPHLLRWIDYIQNKNKDKFGGLFEPIVLEIPPFNLLPIIKAVKKVDSNTKQPAQEAKEVTRSKEDSKVAKGKEESKVANCKEDLKGAKGKEDSKGAKGKEDSKVAKSTEESKGAKSTDKKAAVDNQAVVDKKKVSSDGADGKDNETSVSLLRIQVGLVRKASTHPSAESLLVEEIDVGESKHRQVVSGLAKHISPEQLTGRFVVLITNVKPSKLRDVLSEGLVLCASNQDHTVVEPLIVPEGAKVGEIVTFLGHEGKPEDILNPKKKQLEKITPHLSTDADGIATFKGIPFMTSAGPCKSSIPHATVK